CSPCNVVFLTSLFGATSATSTAQIQETITSPFVTSLVMGQDATFGEKFPPVWQTNNYFSIARISGSWPASSVWTLSFLVLSGEPQGSSGYATNSVLVQQYFSPLPAALPLFATGLGALGLLVWRRRKAALAA